MPKHVTSSRKRSGAKTKMQRYRERLRAQGLRPVQIWVPDTRAPDFVKEMRAQSRRAARSPGEEDALKFLDAALLDLVDES